MSRADPHAPATSSTPSNPAVPDAVAPPPRHRRFPLLDGMRALAVGSVVLVHVAVFGALEPTFAAKLLLHLNLGVTIFFLISGFLLYRPFIAHRDGGPEAPALSDYARRRFLRIIPAYWLVLSVLVLVPGLTGVSGGEWPQQYALLQTISFSGPPSCVTRILDCGVAHTWSLAVEMTFYATLPLYVLAAARIMPGRGSWAWARRELGVLALLSATSVVAHFALLDGRSDMVVGGTVLAYVLWFALGMGLAVVSVAVEASPATPSAARLIGDRPLLPWAVAAAGYALLCWRLPPTPFLFEDAQRLVVHLAFGTIALLLMLPAVLGDDRGGLPRRVLGAPAVAWIGLISYGIFLWHYVVTLELGSAGRGLGFWPLLAATVAITVPVAAASYYGLERPLLRLKYRRGASRGPTTILPRP